MDNVPFQRNYYKQGEKTRRKNEKIGKMRRKLCGKGW
jgi:hypothetical protein